MNHTFSSHSTCEIQLYWNMKVYDTNDEHNMPYQRLVFLFILLMLFV